MRLECGYDQILEDVFRCRLGGGSSSLVACRRRLLLDLEGSVLGTGSKVSSSGGNVYGFQQMGRPWSTT